MFNDDNYQEEEEFFRDYSKQAPESLDKVLAHEQQRESRNGVGTIWLMRALAIVFLALLFWLSIFIGSKLFSDQTSAERTYLELPDNEALVDGASRTIDFSHSSDSSSGASDTKDDSYLASTEAPNFDSMVQSEEPYRSDPAPAVAPQTTVSGEGYYVMVGSFHSQGSAQRQADALGELGFTTAVRQAVVSDQTVYRVLIAQDVNRSQADRLAAKARQSGYDVFVFQQ